MSGVIPPLLLHVFMAWTRTTFAFHRITPEQNTYYCRNHSRTGDKVMRQDPRTGKWYRLKFRRRAI